MKLFKAAVKLSALDELDSFECDTMPDQSIKVFFRTNEIEPADFVPDLHQIEKVVFETAQHLKSIDTGCIVGAECYGSNDNKTKLFGLQMN
jgi:hypothetical protein